MKYFKTVLSGLLFVFVSCASLGNGGSCQFYIEKFNAKNEYLETEISYPVFKDSALGGLNERIRNDIFDTGNKDVFCGYDRFEQDMKDLWEEFKIYEKNGLMKGIPGFFSFSAAPGSVYCDSERVSVCIDRYVYSGGAHGNYWFVTYYYDRQNKKYLDVYQATGLSREKISELCRESLKVQLAEYIKDDSYYEWMMGGTDASENKDPFKCFTFDGKILKVLFAPYSVGPYSCGAPVVEIDVEKYQP